MPFKSHFLLVLVAALLGAAPAAAGGPEANIIGGEDASPGEYPAQGFLQIDTPTGSGFCGGTLVAPRFLLTAAHCAVDDLGLPLAPSSLHVKLGHVNHTQATDVYNVVSVEPNAGFTFLTFQHDTAMLRLDRAAPYAPMRVIGVNEAAKWAPGTTARVIGWGRTVASDQSSVSPTLKEANVPIIPDAQCSEAYPPEDPEFFDPQTMVCAYDGVHDTCNGDSGGPLLVPDGGGFVLAGITSWGIGCADAGHPGVYTRLGAPAINEWVQARYPRASFTVPGPIHSGRAVTFTSTSYYPPGQGAFSGFFWDFTGDGAADASGATAQWIFASGGPQLVTLRATTGMEDLVSQQVVAVNGSPTADAGSDYTVGEGRAVRLSGSGADPEGQGVAFAWDVNRDGTFELPGRTPVFSALRIDGPQERVVSLQVCDVAGGCTTDDAVVRIRNVAPRVNAGPDRRVRRGRRVVFRARVSEPAPADRVRVRWTCGNGRRAVGRTASCRYSRRGVFTVRVTATDDNGGRSTDRVRVRVR